MQELWQKVKSEDIVFAINTCLLKKLKFYRIVEKYKSAKKLPDNTNFNHFLIIKIKIELKSILIMHLPRVEFLHKFDQSASH